MNYVRVGFETDPASGDVLKEQFCSILSALQINTKRRVGFPLETRPVTAARLNEVASIWALDLLAAYSRFEVSEGWNENGVRLNFGLDPEVAGPAMSFLERNEDWVLFSPLDALELPKEDVAAESPKDRQKPVWLINASGRKIGRSPLVLHSGSQPFSTS